MRPFNRESAKYIERAEAAMARQDWPEAIEHWRKILRKFKKRTPLGVYVRLSISCRRLADYTQAETVINQALKQHGEYKPLYTESAEIAEARQDWPEAVKRWKATIDKSDDGAAAGLWTKLAHAHRMNHDYQKAERAAKQGQKNHPDDVALKMEFAKVASDRQDWPEAVKRWQAIMDELGDNTPADVWANLGLSQRKAGKLAASEATLQKGLAEHVDHLGMYVEAAETAMGRKDWVTALDRWQAVLDKFGDSPSLTVFLRQSARFNASILKRLLNTEPYKRLLANHAKQPAKRKVAIVTAVTKGYDSFKLHEFIDDRFDYFAYTDDGTFSGLGLYKVRTLPPTHLDNPRAIRFVKTHPHSLLSEYETVVWLDTSIMIVGDIYPLLQEFMESGHAIGAGVHPVRQSIYEELEACIALKKDDPEDLKRQMEFYKSIGFDKPLAECGFLAFNLRDRPGDVASAMETWWDQICRFSRRDQLSFPYALASNNVEWYPLTRPPKEIRNHPDFVIMPHHSEQLAAKTLAERLQKIIIRVPHV